MNWKIIFIILATIIVVGVVGLAIRSTFIPESFGTVTGSTNNLASNVVGSNNVASTGSANTAIPVGNVQNANLALINFKYVLTPNKLVKGVPVSITVDASTLSGCMKTVVIKDFGVNKYITSSDNIIAFTPDKTGTFWITCSMGMGPGSFEVVNSDGTSDPTAAKTTTPSAQASSPAKTAGGCAMASGGGCGCGGR